MKKLMLFPAMFAATFAITSCGSDSTTTNGDTTKGDSMAVEAPKASFADICTEASKITMTIKGYKYDMSGDYAYETPAFDVKESNVTWTNDSNATITLKNYKTEELVGDRKDDQIDIVIELYARHGKKVGPGTYKHGDSNQDMSSFTTMTTSKGKVYFNWVLGMPDQGSVTIDFIEGNSACGSIMLAVEKPDSDQIGTVRVNGKFRTVE